jgi:hypothetical protein
MWDYIQEGEANVSWISVALTAGTVIGVTDGFYDRVRTGTVSGSGWIICCTKTKQLLWGSFYKILPKAGSYRGELLGLVALHTLIVAVAKHFQLTTAVWKICCDNISALGQAGKAQKRVSAGMIHSDLHQVIQTLKCSFQMDMKYSHVRAHQDRILPWSMLTLEQQLNVICDSLADKAVAQYLAQGAARDNGPQLLPLKKAAVVLEGVKLTTDIGPEAQLQLGMEEPERFYTKPCNIIKGVNRGGLGWSSQRFHAVA